MPWQTAPWTWPADDHRVDHATAVVDTGVPQKLDEPGLRRPPRRRRGWRRSNTCRAPARRSTRQRCLEDRIRLRGAGVRDEGGCVGDLRNRDSVGAPSRRRVRRLASRSSSPASRRNAATARIFSRTRCGTQGRWPPPQQDRAPAPECPVAVGRVSVSPKTTRIASSGSPRRRRRSARAWSRGPGRASGCRRAPWRSRRDPDAHVALS